MSQSLVLDPTQNNNVLPPQPIEATPNLLADPVVTGICQRAFRSPFFWALVLVAGTIAAITVAAAVLNPVAALCVTGCALSILGIAFYVQSKETQLLLWAEFSLTLNKIIACLSGRTWWNEIYGVKNDDGSIANLLTLGAIPLKEHRNAIAEHHDAVLDMTLPLEKQPYLFGEPVTEKDWQEAGVKYFNLPTQDLKPVDDHDIDQGVAVLDEYISQGRSVYVHCQSGVGRSASVVLCYLIQHQNMQPAEAVAYVRERRWIVATDESHAVSSFIERSQGTPEKMLELTADLYL